jgi:ketosteroid isomerase-like protein
MTEPTSLAAVAAHHFRAVIEKRVDAIVDRYAPGEDTYVFVEGPRWSTRGHDRIATGWRAFVDAPMSVRSCDWVEGPLSQVVGDLGWIGGIVELVVAVRGRERRARFRGSFVMHRHTDGEWRIVHEHFSQPAADPYGIGDWLAGGQTAG